MGVSIRVTRRSGASGAATHASDGSLAPYPLPRITRWHIAIFCVALALLLATALRVVGATSVTGDEPAYLLQAYGLWHFHSPDLAPALRDPSIYLRFYPSQPSDLVRDFAGNGERVIVFLPGYAALISPLFVLGGRPMIAVAQALVAAVVAVLLYDEALRLFAARSVAVFAVLAYLATLPVLVFTGEVFPTIFALGLIFTAYVLVARVLPHVRGRRLFLAALALGLISFVLPWLHTKYALIALVLPCAGLFAVLPRPWRRPSRQAWYAVWTLVALPLLSFVLILLYSRHYFGTWIPPYNPNIGRSFSSPHFSRAPRLYLQIFFDAQIGLIPWVPLYFFAPLGFILLARRAPRSALLLLACVLGIYVMFLSVIVAQYVNEAYAFPGRFSIESTPFLALCVASIYATTEPSLRQALFHLTTLLRRGERLRLSARWSPMRLFHSALAVLCLIALGFGGWLAGVAQLDPALLYPSHAGPRLTYEFPHLMPAAWFAPFPESESPLIYSGAAPLDPYFSHGIPITDAAGDHGYLAARAPGKDGDVVAESSPLALPPGTYDATVFVTCDPALDQTATFEAAALRSPYSHVAVPVGSQRFTGAVCQGDITRVPLRFRFASDGYRLIGLAVRTESALSLSVWSMTYGPASATDSGIGDTMS